MTHTLAYDFSINKENKTIVITREFAARRDRVWDAYTRREILDTWWAPRPWKAKTKSLDFHEGGKWLYAMVGPGGEEHWSTMQYVLIKPTTEFSTLDAFYDSQGNINREMPRSTWDITFEDKGDHTTVQIVLLFDDVAQLEATLKTGFKEGLAMGMENLDEVLAA